jgi:hypothetical protein
MKGLVWFGMALLLVVGPAGADVVDSPASGPPEGWVTGPDGQVTFTTQGQAVHLGTFTGRSTVTFEGRSYTTDGAQGSSTGHGYYAVPEPSQYLMVAAVALVGGAYRCLRRRPCV